METSIMLFRTLLIGALTLAGLTTAVLAEEITVENRINVMKKIIGPAVKPAALMANGKQEYDAAAAKKSMETIAAAIATFPSLFPPGSENVKDEAAPTIWSDPEGFKAAAAKLETDAKAAAAAADQGLDAFKAAFNTVGEDCGGCHQKYRQKED
jgi:cytochrome c556